MAKKPEFDEKELLDLWEALCFIRGKEFQALDGTKDFESVRDKIRVWFEEAVPGMTLR